MTKLDTLLLELEKLEQLRTPLRWEIRNRSEFVIENLNDDEVCHLRASNLVNDAAFIVKAVNSNKVLREVIKIQREALKKIDNHLGCEGYSQKYEIASLEANLEIAREVIEVNFLRACQALEAAERVCEGK